MKTEIRYRWRVLWVGKWVTTGYHCTEEVIRRSNPAAKCLEHTREELLVPETKEEEAQRLREGSFVARCHPDQT